MSSDDEHPLTIFSVPIRAELQSLGGQSLLLSRLIGWVGLVAFAGLAMLCGILAAVSLKRNDVSDACTGFTVATFFAACAFLALFLIRRSRPSSPQRQLMESNTVMTVTSHTIEFPEIPGRQPAESWPLNETRTSAKPGKFGWIIFHRDGHESRTILQYGIDEPVADLQARITALQRRSLDT